MKKISKLLNTFGRKDKRPRLSKIFERIRSIPDSAVCVCVCVVKEGKRERGGGRQRKEGRCQGRRQRPRKAHICLPCIYCHMHIYRRVHFRALGPRIGERRLFASRHLVAKSVGLFAYLLLRILCVPCFSLPTTPLAFFFTFSHPCKCFRAQALRETANTEDLEIHGIPDRFIYYSDKKKYISIFR